ncbi:MAG: EamA family transporter [Chloroflexota bacterium]|nr:EamA family transporter [Chloroflexota bacterium]
MNQQLLSSLWLILVSTIAGVAGQVSLKLGMSQPGAEETVSEGVLSLIALILRTPLVWLGLMFYGIGALAWIAVLSRLDLSVAYPFLALNFVLITIISRLFLGETVPLLRWAGIGVIVVGILLVARSTTAS